MRTFRQISSILTFLALAGIVLFFLPQRERASRTQTIFVEARASQVLSRLAGFSAAHDGREIAASEVVSVEEIPTAALFGESEPSYVVRQNLEFADGASGIAIYRIEPEGEGSSVTLQLDQQVSSSSAPTTSATSGTPWTALAIAALASNLSGTTVGPEASSPLRNALFEFNPPERVTRTEQFSVEAQVRLPETPRIQGLTQSQPSATYDVQIAEEAHVELETRDFEVVSHTGEPVEITANRPGLWTWELRPRRAGPDRQILMVLYRVRYQGDRNIRTLERAEVFSVNVEVTPNDWVPMSISIAREYWFLIVAAVASIIGLGQFYFWAKDRRRAKGT